MKEKLKCILLVDDDRATNFLNRKVIEKADIAQHIEVATNGQEALDYLTNEGKYANPTDVYPQPELLFLDINMPVMNGWEFLKEYDKLKGNQKCEVIIMMLTTSQNPDDEMKAKAISNIKGFQQKPLTQKIVEEILQEHFPDKI